MAPEKLNSKLKNLSISALPNDNLNIVISKPKNYQLTDRLRQIIKYANPDISQKAGPDGCPTSISSSVPKYMLTQIVDLFKRNISSCYTETNLLVVMCQGYVANTSSDFIDVQRSFWRQVDRVYDELGQKEKEVNGNSAILRAVTMPVSSNCQTVANSDLLSLTFAREDPTYLDQAFCNNYPLYLEPQPDLSSVVSEVVEQNPHTIGLSGRTPATNVVDIEHGETLENIETSDFSEGGLMNDSYRGMLSLFSNTFLNTPLNRIKELGGNSTKLSYETFVRIPSLSIKSSAAADKTLTKGDFDTVYYEAYLRQSFDTTGIDFDKSLLEQDWVVQAAASNTTILTNAKISHSEFIQDTVLINVIELVNTHTQYKYKTSLDKSYDSLRFQGVVTRRVYTSAELYSFGSALRALWERMKNIKLPTPQQIATGTNLLAMGLGAAGKITGSASLTDASHVLKVITDGLGTLVPAATTLYVPRANGADRTKGSIYWHANSIIPNLVRLGYEQAGKEVMGAQRLRQILASQTRDVLQAYASTGEKPRLSNFINVRTSRHL